MTVAELSPSESHGGDASDAAIRGRHNYVGIQWWLTIGIAKEIKHECAETTTKGMATAQ